MKELQSMRDNIRIRMIIEGQSSKNEDKVETLQNRETSNVFTAIFVDHKLKATEIFRQTDPTNFKDSPNIEKSQDAVM